MKHLQRSFLSKSVDPQASSRRTRETLWNLGRLIRLGRTERRMTRAELAERAGISPSLLARIERGEPGCAVGSVFEAAELAGVPLMESDLSRHQAVSAAVENRLTLLPRAVRSSRRVVDDDF